MDEDEDEGGKHEKMQKGTITLTKLLLIKISDDLAVKEIITDHQAIRREMHWNSSPPADRYCPKMLII